MTPENSALIWRVFAENIADIVSIAPYLKPSVLAKLSERCSEHGIGLSSLVELAKYLNDGNTVKLLECSSRASIEPELIEKLFPLLDIPSGDVILRKILDGEMDWHILNSIHPYYGSSLIEAAVIAGALPWEALDILRGRLKQKYLRCMFGASETLFIYQISVG